MFHFQSEEKKKELAKLYRQNKITSKQEDGDDGYCYVIRIDGKVFVRGLTRAELGYYKEKALKHIQEQQISN